MAAMQQEKKEILNVEAAGERYKFQVKPTGFKLQMSKISVGEKKA